MPFVYALVSWLCCMPNPTPLECSVVVLDEIHEVAGGRGHTYRSLLCKLRWARGGN